MGSHLMSTKFQFTKIKFWSWVVVTVVQQYELLNATELHILKW